MLTEYGKTVVIEQAQIHNRTSKLFCLPKAGNRADEYEDAWALDDVTGVYAVADGASDSAYAGLWARLLAQHWVAHPVWPGDASWAAWLDPVQVAWQAAVQADLIPWYVAARVREGAFATLVGVEIDPDGTWRALAVGDSCLFQVPAARSHDSLAGLAEVVSFPLHSASEFTQHPQALASNPMYNETSGEQAAITGGTLQPGDALLLSSDALAHWALSGAAVDEQHVRLRRLLDLADAVAFDHFVADQRAAGTLRNDDCTLLIISAE